MAREPSTAGDLLSSRPHTELAGDDLTPDEQLSESEYNAGDLPEAGEYDDSGGDDGGDDGEIPFGETLSKKQQREHESRLNEANDQLSELLEDAQEGDIKLTDYQRYWRRLQSHVLHHINQTWRLDGPTRAAAAHAGSIVESGQKVGSQLTQLYGARHLGINFTPFDPGPDIIERPGSDKLTVYSRPIRERSLEAQLSRLDTLANTDLQLAKVRTLFSAFDEDQKVNRAPIRAWRRVTGGNPCALCEIAADQLYFTDDLMPIHDNCMCDVEMADAEDISEDEAQYHHIGFVQTLLDTGDQQEEIQTLADADAPAEDYYNLTKIEQHGELGPVIAWSSHEFTGPGDLPNPLPVRPVPTISGPGAAHERRLAENRARVAQYRRQHFGPGGRAAPRYAEGHGKGSTYKPPEYGLPPITKTTGPKPKPKPKPVEMGHVTATIGPEGKVTITRPGEVAARAVREHIDWNTASLDDMLDYMAKAHADSVPRGSWRLSLWTSPKYNRVAKRRTLQAVDEMLTKYPDVKFDGGFRIAKLEDNVVAETSYSPRLDGKTQFITFNTDIMERTPDEMTAAFKNAEDKGFYFTGASEDPYRAMVYHEFGHSLDVRGLNQAREQVDRLVAGEFSKSGLKASRENLAAWMGEKDRLSGYSMADYAVPGKISPVTGKPARLSLSKGESIAQAFDDVERRGDKASDVSKALHAEVVERAKIPYPEKPLTPGYERAALQQPETAVERLRKVTAAPTPWTDAQYAKEDNHLKNAAGEEILSDEHRAYAKELAVDLYQRGAGVEKAITAAAKSSVEHNGGYMSGLQFRLKEGPSLYRKIQSEAIEIANGTPVTKEVLDRAAGEIKDSVRYTGVMPVEGYWDKGNDLRKALESLGATTIKDPQGIPLEGYRGRNMAFEYHGVPFEMQVHTELGVALKEENHEIYNVSRKLKDELEAKGLDPLDNPEYRRMLKEMQTYWDDIPIAKGTPVVPTEKAAKSKDPGQILYVAKSTAFRGPTVPGGEAPLDNPEMIHREMVPSARYGMDFVPGRAKIVAGARAISDEAWNTLPVQTLPHGTLLHANEPVLKARSIRKVVSGNVPFREGYVTKLYRDDNGGLHVVDGHHRVAMYNALGKDMPVRIIDAPTVERLAAEPMVHDAMVTGLSEDSKGWGSVLSRLPEGKTITPVYKTNKDGKQILDAKATWASISDEDLKQNWRLALQQAAPWAQAAGADWYPGVGRMAERITDKYADEFEKRWGVPLDKDLTAAFLASWSENNNWAGNLVGVRKFLDGTGTAYQGRLADFNYDEARDYKGTKDGNYGTRYVIPAGPKDKSAFAIPGEQGRWKFYDFHVNKALRAMQNPRGGIADLRENAVTAPKPADFGANIAGDYSRATADRWVARILLHTDDSELAAALWQYKATTKGVEDRVGYKRLSKALMDVANEPENAHLNAAAVQAIPWVHVVGPLGSIGEIDDLSSYAGVTEETLRKAAEFGDVE